MQSKNFEFLRLNWKDLADLGAFAEQYAHPDPQSAVGKLRTFAEQIVNFIYHKHGLPKPYQCNLNDLLTNATFVQAVPKVILNKLHSLRIQGNRGAHGETVLTNAVLWLLQEAYELGQWMHLSYANGSKAHCPAFVPPSATNGTEAEKKLKREKVSILEQLAAQEGEMQKLLAELESARSKVQVAEATAAQLQAAQEKGQQVAETLAFDEEATRRNLIDSLLVAAGWKVGPNGTSTDQVGQEVKVHHQPTPSGDGEADYVLWGDDGKPLGVIEGKKTAIHAEAGRTKAKCYADGLERMYGQRPVIFYTNGHDILLWNDKADEPPRKMFGFYSKDSLQYLHYQRSNRESLLRVAPNPAIAERMYQIEAIKRVAERFAAKHRQALIVQATGTGKTRVAISLCDLLLRAKWAKRILFLCDRRELRKQAHNVFKQFLPGEPRIYVTAATSRERDKRIYLATYPAMMDCYQTFDVGFFDVIIADESHRIIYNRYQELFAYFDALQVGLTATPVELIARNTYKVFGCEDRDPTVYFSFEDAIKPPGFLVPFEVITHTTPFLRKGIKYSEMSDEQKRQLEENEAVPAAVEYEQAEVDKAVFNKDTNRTILRNLMESGIRDGTGTRVGKSIIFARNHNHAVLLQNLFDEMYPQYGGKFCRVIDSHDDRAEELIDDFKGEGNNPDLTIAISVDMLDTGIDVPKIVNLVFAKPVYSFVKFWQMIGRGTRLCENLFGPGQHKTHFLIFDHWKNFEFFDQGYTTATPKQAKSLPQVVFESRIKLAETALRGQDQEAFETAIGLIAKDIADLPGDSVAIKEKWKEIEAVSRPETLRQFDATTKNTLLHEIAPLMQWRNISGNEDAHKFDLLVSRLQTEHLKKSSSFDDLKVDLQEQLDDLRMNLSQVKAVAPTIAETRTANFWNGVSVAHLENLRDQLRGVMQYRQWAGGGGPISPKVIDIKEDPALVERKKHVVKLEGLQLAAYRNRVEKVLRDLFEKNETLQRIKKGQPVTEADLEALTSLVLTQDPSLDLHDLVEYYPDCAGHLDLAIRSIIGLDAAAVHQRFTAFVQKHPMLKSSQIRFLDLLQNHIAKYGSIEVARLYEPPFTTIHSDSLDGLFPNEDEANGVIQIIESFQPPKEGATVA